MCFDYVRIEIGIRIISIILLRIWLQIETVHEILLGKDYIIVS